MLTESYNPTFYFHDYETFGIHPAYDRPVQFAGIRTDADFNIIEEPLVVYCKPADDYLPEPEAVLVTGITPQLALKQGKNEAQFSQIIHQAFSQPNTCIVGYNNIRFDDEVSRHLFYRNFYDPYAYSYLHGNSRWDLIDVVRACHALRPEGINWPLNDKGLPSFRLEHLTIANQIEHENAHDAMSDVYATIAIARLVKQAQPRLFSYLFQLRDKKKVAAQINIAEMTPLIHVSGMFGAKQHHLSIVAPLAWHPTNNNAVILCDLSQDISPLFELDLAELKSRLYTAKASLKENESPVPIKLLHVNKCPVIAPLNTLLAENSQRSGLDLSLCLQRLESLKKQPQIREKVIELFYENNTFTPSNNVDGQLYHGFFNDADRATMKIIRETSPYNLPALDFQFHDPRFNELLFRFRARNYPETLSEKEQQRWFLHRQGVFNQQTLTEYAQKLDHLFVQYQDEPEKIKLLKSLYYYVQQLTS